MVLKDIPKDVRGYAPKDWETKLPEAYPAVLSFPEHGLQSRDVMLGIEAFGQARAWRYQQVRQEQLIADRLGSEEILLVLGPDGESVRAFRKAGDDFFRTSGGDTVMIDSATGSRWNFKGCAVEGKLKGACLELLPVMKDFWFDWRKYHPATTFYAGAGRKKH
jgi:hypothetical protein